MKIVLLSKQGVGEERLFVVSTAIWVLGRAEHLECQLMKSSPLTHYSTCGDTFGGILLDSRLKVVEAGGRERLLVGDWDGDNG